MNAIFVDDPNNIGDALSTPKHYFSVCAQAVTKDLRVYTALPKADKATYLGDAVIGGGGLLYDTIRPVLNELLMQPRKVRLVVWGIGMNTHGLTVPDYPKFLDGFDLVGVRDWKSPYIYVPCASCLHTDFDRNFPPPAHEVVFYEHRHHALELAGPGIPRESNKRAANQMSEVLAFLASGKTVVTNTYHGAYWAMLLGRPVVVFKPFSNRFFGFKPAMVYADETNWEAALSKAAAIPRDYLEECRACNRRFNAQVEMLFK